MAEETTTREPEPSGPAGLTEPAGLTGPAGLTRPGPEPGWSERLARITDAAGLPAPRRIVAIAVIGLGLALVGAAGYVLLRPAPAMLPEASIPFADPSVDPDAAAVAGDSTSTSAAGSVLAHAAGAVAAPGVYELPAGSRVSDLVAAAGGAAADADLNRVNLAAPVEDGQQVYVPRIGEAAPSGDTGGPAATGGEGSPPGRIDVNTASAEALDELPGIGPAIAQAIISYRDEHGPFGSVDELVEVPGIGEAKLAQLRDLITV
jgi:competence protein ComEA